MSDKSPQAARPDTRSSEASPPENDGPWAEPAVKLRPGCVTYSLVALLVIVLSVWGGKHLWERSARLKFESTIAPQIDKGEPIWFQQLALPPPAPERDGTQAFRRAAQAMEANRARTGSATQMFFEKHFGGTGPKEPVLLKRYSPADLENFRQTLAENEEALDHMQQLLRRGDIQLALKYDSRTPYFEIVGEVGGARVLALVAHAETVLALDAARSGQNAEAGTDAALQHVLEQFAFGRLLRHGPFLVFQVTRIAIGTQAIEDAQYLLSHVPLSAEQRAQLDLVLQQTEVELRLHDTLIGERAAMLTSIDQTEFANAALDTDNWSGLDPDLMRGYSWLPAWRYEDMSSIIPLMTQAAEVIDQTGPEGFRRTELMTRAFADLPETSLARSLAPPIEAAHRSAMVFRQRLNALRLAIRVDASYRHKGQFPATLDEVLDETLPAIPPGMLSGQPPVYRVRPTGFLIYDVGTDGVDDNLQQRDELDSSVELIYPELLPPGETPPNSPDANPPAGNQ